MNKFNKLSIILSILLATLSYSSATNSSPLNTEDLTLIGKAVHGNSKLSLYKDLDGTRWVLSPHYSQNGFDHLKTVAETYITSKVLNFLLSDSIVPIVAEVRLLSDFSFGTASKWLNGFTPLIDLGIDKNVGSAIHPKELNDNLILNREKLALATDFTGTIDRNPGNIGVVIANEQYIAAQVDYNETFNCNGFKDLMMATLNGGLDVNSVLKEIDQLMEISESSIELLIDDAKEDILMWIGNMQGEKLGFLKYKEELAQQVAKQKLKRSPFGVPDRYVMEKRWYGDFDTEDEFKSVLSQFIINHINDIKLKLINQKNALIDARKITELYGIIINGCEVDEFLNFVNLEFYGTIPYELNIKYKIKQYYSEPTSLRLKFKEVEETCFLGNLKQIVERVGNTEILNYLQNNDIQDKDL